MGTNPRQLQFEFSLWTREIVREVIRREFGVALSAVSVGRLLRTLGLSPQRPLSRAYQQDPDAVERWKAQEYPAIRAEANRLGATIYFAEEASVRSDYHAETTWAPLGQTPVVATTGARLSVNMISAVTASGSFKYDIVPGRLNAAKFIDFCDKLLADTPGPVFLIVEGHPVHRSNAVKEYVATTNGRLRLFRLPSYSPELNPDEGVWKTSNTTPSAAAPPPVSTTSLPPSSLHLSDSPSYLNSSEHSSATPTSITSPPEQSTYLRSP
ncbi:MAG TPA: IS630 family transposase [Pseudonocardiaceae bacterium]